MNEAPTGAAAMAGTFLANGYPAVVLFDSGASHTFISSAFIARNNVEVDQAKNTYHIKSPGGQLVADQMVKNLALDLNELVY